MEIEKFDTLVYLLGNASREMAKGAKEQHVTIVSSNGYNLSLNMVLHAQYPEIVKYAPKLEFSEINFLSHVPAEFAHDLSLEQLKDLFSYLKTIKQVSGLSQHHDSKGLFLFTDKEIILMLREEYDKSEIN